MRDIRFRIWDREAKQWLRIFDINPHGVVTAHEGGNMISPLIPPSQLKLVQYTGIKDIHGLDIYEGDIFKTWQSTGSGKLKTGIQKLKQVMWSKLTHNHMGWNIAMTGKYEIIGNIYENKELLQ